METYGIEKLGILEPKAVYRNLSPAQLTEAALRLGEGSLSNTGALVVTTGKYTGRSPKDKFIVDTEGVHDEIAWGKVNRPISREKFNSIKGKIAIRKRVVAYGTSVIFSSLPSFAWFTFPTFGVKVNF